MSAIDLTMLETRFYKGDRKRDGLAVNGDAGHSSIQVPTNKPATRATPMKVTEMSHPSPFFLPTYKAAPGTRACHLFLLGRGDRDAIVTTGGTRIPKTPGMKSDMRAVPTRNNQCHIILHRSLGNNQRQRPMYKVYKRLLKFFGMLIT